VPVTTAANLGVIKRDAVNVAVNGHNPLLSDILCDVAADLDSEAISAGAREGINIIGVCCTGAEVMARRGVPLATNYLSQELPILTGALEAMVIDMQCVMPSLTRVAECFHTLVFTTDDRNKICGAIHVPFEAARAAENARTILRRAVAAFGRRDPNRIHIPGLKQKAVVGFSVEALVGALSAVDRDVPLRPLVDGVVKGDIQGVALFAGCNTTSVRQDSAYGEIARSLAERNVLLLATGCAAGAFAKMGMTTPEATEQFAGPSLKKALISIGNAAGFGGALPLVLHMGSCVDNSRAVSLATALANGLGVDISDLPIVASAPECMTEKSIAIAAWAIALGVPTHLGSMPPLAGSQAVTELLTSKAKDLLGGYFIIDTNPQSAADKLYAAIQERRRAMGQDFGSGFPPHALQRTSG
jgi:anaerobic carbon-monoxide dehydrogenase catalytic subunit